MTDNAIEKIINTEIKLDDITEVVLSMVEEKWETVPDCSTKEGYEIVRVGIGEVVGIRTGAGKAKKKDKEGPWNECKRLDAKYNGIVDRLAPIEEKLKKAKGDVDKAKAEAAAIEIEKEKQRVLSICGAIDAISNTANVPFGATMSDIKMSLVGIENEIVTEKKYQEFTGKAVAAKSATITKLTAMIKEASINEAMALELAEEQKRISAEQDAQREKIRIESEAFEAKITAEREEREAEYREAAAKRAEEQSVIDAERAKESAKLAAERAEIEAEREAIRIENEKVQAEAEALAEKERIAAEKKKAAKKTKAIRADISNALVLIVRGDYPEEDISFVDDISEALMNNEIPHVEYKG